MTTPVPFAYGDHPVRTVTIDDEPWFVAADVCAVLGYRNPRSAVERHVREIQLNTVAIRDGNRGNPNMLVISEGGLYRLIMRSDMPGADEFQDWVTDEVLPALRKTGTYSVVPQTYAEALRAHADEVERRELAETRVAELAPAAEQFHRWQFSGDTVYLVEWAKTIGLTQQEAYKALRETGVLFKQQHEGMAFNVPKRGYEHLFALVDEWLPGPQHWVKVPKITAEGQVVLAELMLERGWIAG